MPNECMRACARGIGLYPAALDEQTASNEQRVSDKIQSIEHEVLLFIDTAFYSITKKKKRKNNISQETIDILLCSNFS